jgi:hypothetical protein
MTASGATQNQAAAVIDRASILAAAVLCVIRARGTGAEARAEIVALLRDELADVERTTLHEIRLRDE